MRVRASTPDPLFIDNLPGDEVVHGLVSLGAAVVRVRLEGDGDGRGRGGGHGERTSQHAVLWQMMSRMSRGSDGGPACARHHRRRHAEVQAA